MTDTLKQAIKLRTEMEEVLRQKERAKGALEAKLKELKAIGADSSEDGERLLAKMDRRIARDRERFQQELEALENEWKTNQEQAK